MSEFLVKAHHDYEAQREDELNLATGDIVSVTDKSGNDWWQGEKAGTGESGWFPSNFVDPVSDSTSTAAPAPLKPSSGNSPVLARVLEDFVAAEPDELSLWRGGVVTVLEQMEGWWRGDLNGKTGIFPATYVKLISEELPVEEAEPTEVKPKFKLAAYGVKQGGVGALFAGGIPTLKKKKASIDEGVSPLAHAPPPPQVEPPKPAIPPPVQPSADKLPSLPVTSPSSSPADTPVSSQLTSQAISTPLAKAIVTRNYDAELQDEISLIRGEYITIVDRNVGDGWWKGTNERSETGIFPSDCVLELQDEVASSARPSRSSRQASRPQSEIPQATSPSSITPPPSLPNTTRTPSQASISETSVSQDNPGSSPPPSRINTEEVISPTISSPPRVPLARPPRPPSVASFETPTSPTTENTLTSRLSIHSVSDAINEEGEPTEGTAHARMAKPPKTFLSKTGVALPAISPRSPPPHSRSTSTGTLTSPTSQLSPTELSATESGPRIPSRPPPSQSSDSSSRSIPHHDANLSTLSGQSSLSMPVPEEIEEDEEATATEASANTAEDEDEVTSVEDVKDSAVSEPGPKLDEEAQEVELTAKPHETTETDLKSADAESNPTATEEEIQELEAPSETPKKIELPELPSGPKLTGPSRARPMPNRRGISGNSMKEGIVSQTSVLQEAVDKDPEPEPATKLPTDEDEIPGRAPPPKPVKPIFNKIPTAFAKAAEGGAAPTFPLRKVERKWESTAGTATTTATTDDKDKDSGVVRESAGPVRSVASRFNQPSSGGGNEVLETKLKNFVKSEVEKIRKELEAVIAEERAKRIELEAEVDALRGRLG